VSVLATQVKKKPGINFYSRSIGIFLHVYPFQKEINTPLSPGFAAVLQIFCDFIVHPVKAPGMIFVSVDTNRRNYGFQIPPDPATGARVIISLNRAVFIKILRRRGGGFDRKLAGRGVEGYANPGD
jgi:hypothetical protein